MAVYMPPKSIPAEKVSVAPQHERPDQGTGTGKGGQPAGLNKFMNAPAGTFDVGHSSGAPSVADGGSNYPNEPRVGETNMHVGSSMQPTVPKNVYMPDKKVVYGVA